MVLRPCCWNVDQMIIVASGRPGRVQGQGLRGGERGEQVRKFLSFLSFCAKKVFVQVACKWDHFYHFQILGQCQVSSYSQSWSLVTTLISCGFGHDNKEIVGDNNMVMMVNYILHLIGEERQSQTMLSWRPCTSRCLSLKPFPVCMSVTFGSNKLQLSTTWD